MLCLPNSHIAAPYQHPETSHGRGIQQLRILDTSRLMLQALSAGAVTCRGPVGTLQRGGGAERPAGAAGGLVLDNAVGARAAPVDGRRQPPLWRQPLVGELPRTAVPAQGQAPGLPVPGQHHRLKLLLIADTTWVSLYDFDDSNKLLR